MDSVCTLSIENIGGITDTEIDIGPGVTVLSGENATNRTSFLRALMIVMGSSDGTLKADADVGSVQLSIGDETYSRHLRRENGTVKFDGEPHLDDPEAAELFAFLLEDNESRRAVERGWDLREITMRPVEIESIQRQIDQRLDEKRQVVSELDDLDSLSEERAQLAQKRTEIENEIERLEERLSEKQQAIDDRERDVESVRAENETLEDKLSDLQECRSDLADIQFDIDTEQESIDSLKTERADIEQELSELSDDVDAKIERLESELRQLKGRKESLDTTLAELRSIIEFNEEMLAGGETDLVSFFESRGGSTTDKLLDDAHSVRCWTCGSAVKQAEIETTLDRLRSLREEKYGERTEIADEIERLQSQRSECQRQRDRRSELETKLEKTNEELEERITRLDDLRDKQESLQAEIERLESSVSALQDEIESDILELHTETNELTFEIERKESELADIDDQIDEIDERLEKRTELETRQEQITEELTDLRTHVERIEQEVVDTFNTQMDRVLDVLRYDNIERIWIERIDSEGHSEFDTSSFDLHIVRTTDDGTAYEDTIDHLSESEREITGLVFALAGYLTHEVYTEVPFLILDSLEAIDADRIAAFVDLLREYADNIVVALLPEDAAALSDEYAYIEQI